jgi:hypothetical protein
MINRNVSLDTMRWAALYHAAKTPLSLPTIRVLAHMLATCDCQQFEQRGELMSDSRLRWAVMADQLGVATTTVMYAMRDLRRVGLIARTEYRVVKGATRHARYVIDPAPSQPATYQRLRSGH